MKTRPNAASASRPGPSATTRPPDRSAPAARKRKGQTVSTAAVARRCVTRRASHRPGGARWLTAGGSRASAIISSSRPSRCARCDSSGRTRFAAIRAAGRLADTVHRATRGHPERSVRYRELLSGHHFVDELRINFDHHGGRWGSAALMRERDQQPYGADELRLAARAARAIGTALSRYALPTPATAAATKMDGPAVAVISAAGRLTAADPAAEALLAELADDPRSGALPGSRGSARTTLPTAITTIVEQARGRLGPGRGGAPVRARLRRASGQWLTLHASLLEGRPDGAIAVVARPATPAEVIPLTLMAHRLTPREQEVALAALRGRSTREIAAELFLSPVTVQDHLKAVFDKTGVRSRRELVALLMTRTLAEAGL
ncbi:response regulator transcription factor [Streptomyces jumonjinensis]|uniref:response regulator transcription factor n=1 Tax=Streptomyces jumonjinensis TaxID=1945 RepID=UPI00379AF156